MAPSLSSFHFFLEDSASQTTSHPQGDICSLKTMLSVLGLGVLAKKPGLGLVLSGSYAGSLEAGVCREEVEGFCASYPS